MLELQSLLMHYDHQQPLPLLLASSRQQDFGSNAIAIAVLGPQASPWKLVSPHQQ